MVTVTPTSPLGPAAPQTVQDWLLLFLSQVAPEQRAQQRENNSLRQYSLGSLSGIGGGFGPFGAGTPGPFPSGSGGFTASAPGQDFGGYDTSPDLVTKRGITGIAPAVRRLADIERHFDVNLPVVSDYRSSEQQAALYQQHLAGQHPAPVAPPGQSYHEQGEAFDITAAWLSAHPEVRRALTRSGFTFDVPGEPWHAHFVGGPRRYNPQRPPSPSVQSPPEATTRNVGRTSGRRRSRGGLADRRRYVV